MINLSNKVTKLLQAVLLILILLSLSNKSYSQDDPTQWTYFRIFVMVSDDPVFEKVLTQLNVTDEFNAYMLVVNISDSTNQYVLIGDEKDPAAVKECWQVLSKEVQDGLINWIKPNKINLKE